jgi:hypothetical protein
MRRRRRREEEEEEEEEEEGGGGGGGGLFPFFQMAVFHQILYVFLSFSILATCYSSPLRNTLKPDV